MTDTTEVRYDATGTGHDDRCDLRECPTLAAWAVAEACCPDLLIGDAALAFYCDQHVATAPVAAREAVEKAAARFVTDLWPALVASYPNPIPVWLGTCLEEADKFDQELTLATWDLIEEGIAAGELIRFPGGAATA